MKKLIALIASMALFAVQASVLASNTETVSDFDASAVTAAAVTAAPTELPEEAELEDDIETSVQYQAYEQIAQYIAERYLDDSYTAEDIMKLGLSEYLGQNGDTALVALLKAALQSLDDYSDFYTYDEYVEYNNTLNKTFYGLGITMQQDGEYVTIAGFVEENSLAEQSGFRVGDKIVKVDGIGVVGLSMTEVRNLIVGEIGTTVPITVLRDGQEIEIIGTRTAVNNSTVSGGILEGNVGYIKIASFASGTADEFEEIKNSLIDAGVSKLILDLRNNPGGLVSGATKIAESIVPQGKIVDVKYRDSTLDHTYYSELADAPFKIVALVNGNTASSAEILSSAIQDSGAGILLGNQTFGKAVIQSVYSLRNGMVFKLTIGQYITRKGNEIDHIGLTPDIEVSNYTKKIDTTGYTKFDFLNTASVGSSGTNVSAAKERLSIMGYYIGNLANDVFNTDLADAIREFQKDNALTDSGVLDIPTQIKLKEVFEGLETTIDVQMQEAYKYFGGNVDDLY
ncbi:MAG: S41 family peptidase [Candidatus Ornithomonoglobus sp.]